MAQFFDGINDNPIRKAIYRINWTLQDNTLYGQCPNDGLWRAVVSSRNEGSFTYQCGKAKKTIEFNTNKNLITGEETIALSMTLDNNKKSPIPLQTNSPRTRWLSGINWHIKGECLRGTTPDSTLFRGVVPDAYPENDLYPGEGSYLHEWGTSKKKIIPISLTSATLVEVVSYSDR